MVKRTSESQERNRTAKRVSRRNLTQAQQDAILLQRQQKRAQRSVEFQNERKTGDEEEKLPRDFASGFKPNPIDSFLDQHNQIHSHIYEACTERLSNAFMSEKVCCVCDAFHLTRDVAVKKVHRCPVLIDRMRVRFKSPDNLPNELKSYYDCSDIFEPFTGILLGRNGIIVDNNNSVSIQICSGCCSSLESRNRSHPPKFSIANGLFIGVTPLQFRDTTMTEHAMVNLSQSTRFLAVVRGGKHANLRSHAYYFRADPSPPAKLLPRNVIESGLLTVRMVGAMTTAQKVATTTKYQVRVERLRSLLTWYSSNNHLYQTVKIADNWEEDTLSLRVVSVDATQELNDSNSARTELNMTNDLDYGVSRFNSPTLENPVVSETDESCDHVAASIVTNYVGSDHITAAKSVLGLNDFVVYRSTGILSDFDPAFWIHAFNELFPFGREGLNEPRYINPSNARAWTVHVNFNSLTCTVHVKEFCTSSLYACILITSQLGEGCKAKP